MPLGQHHRGQTGQGAAVVEGEDLAAVGSVVEPYRACPVRLDPYGRRRLP